MAFNEPLIHKGIPHPVVDVVREVPRQPAARSGMGRGHKPEDLNVKGRVFPPFDSERGSSSSYIGNKGSSVRASDSTASNSHAWNTYSSSGRYVKPFDPDEGPVVQIRQESTSFLSSGDAPQVYPGNDEEESYHTGKRRSSEAGGPIQVKVIDPDAGWPAMAKGVREYDEEKVKFCKEDIDTLLVFAGLYSAVLSAFIIESYQYLQPSTQDTMVYLFGHMIAQNYTMSNGYLNATNPRLPPLEFEAPTWAIRVNILWFASLVLSLSATSFGMLVKQWLREYMDIEHTSPQERLRARQYRRPALDHWKVFEIAASLPLLLEVALAFFFVGLCYFTTAIHLSISRITVPLVAAWAFFFFIVTIAPLFSPRCPFKTTLLKGIMRQGRRHVYQPARITIFLLGAAVPPVRMAWKATCATCKFAWDITECAYIVLRLLLACALHIICCLGPVAGKLMLCLLLPLLNLWTLTMWLLAGILWLLPWCGGYLHRPPAALGNAVYHWIDDPSFRPMHTLLHWLRENPWTRRHQERVIPHMYEEAEALQAREDDMAILRSVEGLMPGDGLLPTIIAIARSLPSNPAVTLPFISDIIAHRTGYAFITTEGALERTTTSPDDPRVVLEALPKEVPDLRLLSSQAYDVLVPWLEEVLQSCIHSPVYPQQVWMYLSLLHSVDRPPSEPTKNCMGTLFSSPTASLYLPIAVWRSRRLKSLVRPVFMPAHYDKVLEKLDARIAQSNDAISSTDGKLQSWAIKALHILLSHWTRVYEQGTPSALTRAPFSFNLAATIITLQEGSHESIWPDGLEKDTRLDVYHSIILAVAVTEGADLASRIVGVGPRLIGHAMATWGRAHNNPPIRTEFASRIGLTSLAQSAWKDRWLVWLAPKRQPSRFLEVTMPLMVAWLSAWHGVDRDALRPFEEICGAVLGQDTQWPTPSTTSFPGTDDGGDVLVSSRNIISSGQGSSPALTVDLAVLRAASRYLPHSGRVFPRLYHALEDHIKARLLAYRVIIRFLRFCRSELCRARLAALSRQMNEEQVLLAHWGGRACRLHEGENDRSERWELLRRVIVTVKMKREYERGDGMPASVRRQPRAAGGSRIKRASRV